MLMKLKKLRNPTKLTTTQNDYTPFKVMIIVNTIITKMNALKAS